MDYVLKDTPQLTKEEAKKAEQDDKGCNVIMASHYDIASLVKCVILIVPANDAHFYKNITGKYKYSEKYIKNDILY